MRKLILSMSMSFDGFVADPKGDVQWIFSGDQQAIAWKVAKLAEAGLIIMGSRSFKDMSPFWPTSASVFAPSMNQIPKAVFSKQGPAVLEAAKAAIEKAEAGQLQPGAESWSNAYVAGDELAEEIAKLKAQDGKPIVALGGATFARSLIARNLVDEYALMVHPIALGEGLPIFSDLPEPRRLELVSSKAFPLGAVAQLYRPA